MSVALSAMSTTTCANVRVYKKKKKERKSTGETFNGIHYETRKTSRRLSFFFVAKGLDEVTYADVPLMSPRLTKSHL